MSITLTVKVGAGFYVGDKHFVVESTTTEPGYYSCTVSNGDMDTYSEWVLDQDQWTSPVAGVQLRLSSKRPEAFGSVRVMIEAPDYRVLRDVLYDQNRSSEHV